MRWRMARGRGERIYKGVAAFGRDNVDYIERVYREIVERGPLVASDFDGERGKGRTAGLSNAKAALEWLFWTGRITTLERRPSFEIYDLLNARCRPRSSTHPMCSRPMPSANCCASRRGRWASRPPPICAITSASRRRM